RLHKARNQALRPELAQRNAAQAVLAVVSARAATQLTAVANARLGGVARQLRQFQRRSKTLFHRQLLVVRDRFQLRAPVGVLLRHLAPPVVLLDRTLLRHTFTPCGSAYEGTPSLPEREVERGEQRAFFVVGERAGANGNVEAPGIGDLVEIDLRKDRVFLDAKAVVATAVEALWIEPAEIAHAWQRDIHEAVQEIIHACLAQRDFAADGLAIAQLVGRNRLTRLGDHGFLARDQRQVAGSVIHLLAVGDTLTDAHVEHDLRDRGHLHAVCVAEFLRQLAANDLLVVGLHARYIVGTLARLLHLRLATFRSAAILGAFRSALRLLRLLAFGLLLGISHRSQLRNAWRCAPSCEHHLRRRT